MQTPEETLAQRARLVPRHRLAAGAAAAPPRPRGALRLRLPDPAHARRQSRSTARPAPRSTSPTCTPGPRSTCPAPAGSASTRPRACSPARATSRSPARPSPASAAPITGARRRVRGRVRAPRCRCTRVLRGAARHASRTPKSSGSAIDALGDAGRRASCAASDVRLTMGGEPTFVSVDDRDGAEWNTAALGPTKRGYAGDAAGARCAPASARAASCTIGQGKWYPGEPLPRWALSLLLARGRRADLARPGAVRRRTRATARYTAADAQRFIDASGAAARRSTRRTCMPGYEDACYYLWRERRLPVNVDPLDPRLDDPSWSARACAASSSAGSASVVGYALPLARATSAAPGRWRRAARGSCAASACS